MLNKELKNIGNSSVGSIENAKVDKAEHTGDGEQPSVNDYKNMIDNVIDKTNMAVLKNTGEITLKHASMSQMNTPKVKKTIEFNLKKMFV